MAEEHGFQAPEGHRLCANNCGFFGSPATSNLCSKCYRDSRMKEEQGALAKAAFENNKSPLPSSPSYLSSSSSSKSSSSFTKSSAASNVSDISIPSLNLPESAAVAVARATAVEQVVSQPEPPPAEPEPAPAIAAPSASSAAAVPVAQANRCLTCRKRVGLTGFKCRCGSMFCGSHRYPEQHGCSFDYKTVGKEAIAKANPVIKGVKLQKI